MQVHMHGNRRGQKGGVRTRWQASEETFVGEIKGNLGREAPEGGNVKMAQGELDPPIRHGRPPKGGAEDVQRWRLDVK